MVGNGSHLECEWICNNVQIVLQNKPLNLPFYLLTIEGIDVFLGMAWLRTLGLIQAGFFISSITFNHQDKSITLTEDHKFNPIHTTFHQFHQLLYTDFVASLHLMIMQPLDSS